MTCCVALRVKHKNNRVSLVVGADASACSDNEVVATKDPKVFQYGEYTFAFAGSQRPGQVVKYHFIPPEPSGDLNDFMATTFIDSLKNCFRKAGLFTRDAVDLPDSEFIVVVQKRIFWVGGDFSVLEMRDDMVAIGAGKEYAFGSLYSTQGVLTPVERVRAALSAAAHFSPWVVEPLTVIKVG